MLVLAVAGVHDARLGHAARRTARRPTSGWRSTITSGSYAESVRAVSFSDSPLSTDEPDAFSVIVSADSRFAASSNEDDVRVDDS